MSSIYGSPFPTYVTTTTKQIISGLKTFTNLLTCEDGLKTNSLVCDTRIETNSILFSDNTEQLTAFKKLITGTYTFCRIVVDINGAISSIVSTPSVAVPPGTISMFGGTVAPTGYVLCDGAQYYGGRDSYLGDLYDAIGLTYTYPPFSFLLFNVPDFRGVYPGMPGTNVACDSQDANLNNATFTGPPMGRFQYQSLPVIPHDHTADYPNNTDRAQTPGQESYYRSGSTQQNFTSGVASFSTPNAHTIIGPNVRPISLGVTYIIKY